MSVALVVVVVVVVGSAGRCGGGSGNRKSQFWVSLLGGCMPTTPLQAYGGGGQLAGQSTDPRNRNDMDVIIMWTARRMD